MDCRSWNDFRLSSTACQARPASGTTSPDPTQRSARHPQSGEHAECVVRRAWLPKSRRYRSDATAAHCQRCSPSDRCEFWWWAPPPPAELVASAAPRPSARTWMEQRPGAGTGKGWRAAHTDSSGLAPLDLDEVLQAKDRARGRGRNVCRGRGIRGGRSGGRTARWGRLRGGRARAGGGQAQQHART